MLSSYRVFVGFDPKEMGASVVAERSASVRASVRLDIRRVSLSQLAHQGVYTRATERRGDQLWDVISAAPMSTEHAIARFFVPYLCGYEGWAVFTDGDVLVRGDLAELFALADPTKAVQVVQHPEGEQGQTVKKAGHQQTAYSRKNWSSVMLFNCGHPSNSTLTLDFLNMLPGRDLHRFCWLPDEEIGALPAGWNYLVGVTSPVPEPVQLAHYTLGTPDLPDHRWDDFAQEWLQVSRSCGFKFAAVGA